MKTVLAINLSLALAASATPGCHADQAASANPSDADVLHETSERDGSLVDSAASASVAQTGPTCLSACAAARPDAGSSILDNPSDAGTVPECASLAANNTKGVGHGCTQAARELACPSTRICLQGLVEQGLPAGEPYFCTKDCSQNSDCGESASCCKPKGWPTKICIVDSCSKLCE